MPFIPLVSGRDPEWSDFFADAFSVQAEEETAKTLFRYQIPFPEEKEAIYFAKCGVPESKRKDYYKNMLGCVQRHIAICQHLKEQGVSSILYPEQITQEKAGNSNYIFIQTQSVRPILPALFGGAQIGILTLLDVFIRLSVVARDLSQAGVSHRGFRLDEVYLTPDERIVVGGLYYATGPKQASIIPYMPGQSRPLPKELLSGQGSQALDMRTLAMILYNLGVGVPWDTQWPKQSRIAPSLMPKEVIPVIQFGLNCKEEECNAFRRKLLDCRKAISKTDSGHWQIPIRHRMENIYTYE